MNFLREQTHIQFGMKGELNGSEFHPTAKISDSYEGGSTILEVGLLKKEETKENLAKN